MTVLNTNRNNHEWISLKFWHSIQLFALLGIIVKNVACSLEKKLINLPLWHSHPYLLFSFSFLCAILRRRVGFYVNTFKNVSSLEAKFHKEIALVSKNEYLVYNGLCDMHNSKQMSCNAAVKAEWRHTWEFALDPDL